MATFSSVMTNLLYQTGMKRSDLFRALESRGANISRSCLYEYAAGSQIPSLEKAQEILEAMHVSFSIDELHNILAESVDERNALKISQYERGIILSGGFRIRVRNCSSFIGSDEDIEKAIRIRVSETSNSFNDYLTRLIKKDVDENILEVINDGTKR